LGEREISCLPTSPKVEAKMNRFKEKEVRKKKKTSPKRTKTKEILH